eukprot:TRINITY_DN23846_c0_g1_i1.p1 TRINITY_DN23846_c0_g1~~TRINITY_DN23846_c0_g1_i1.p1  ORF type:complete len:316 (+),score=47.66 TRINITY_DN23846_c0_g1_i1:354-1301(+)
MQDVAEAIVMLSRHAPNSDGSATCLDEHAFVYLMELDTGNGTSIVIKNLQKAFHKEALDQYAFEAKKIVKERKSHWDEPEQTPTTAFALDLCPAVMILLNALAIGVSQDVDQEGMIWEIFNIIFTAFFTGEFLLKCKLYGCNIVLCGRDKLWNSFDLFCICIAYLDMGITYTFKMIVQGDGADLGYLMLLKMLRLARLARLIRLMRFKMFNELKMMVEGVFFGVRVLLWAIVLLFFLIFFLGIVMRTVVDEEYAEFKSLLSAMFTLFRCFTDGCTAYDGTPLQERLRQGYGQNVGSIFMIIYLGVLVRNSWLLVC